MAASMMVATAVVPVYAAESVDYSDKLTELNLKLGFDQTVYSGNCQVVKNSDFEVLAS